MDYIVPGVGTITLNTLVLDLNGTLTVKGVVPDGLVERLAKLKSSGFECVLLSGDQRGTAKEIAERLDIQVITTPSTEDKERAAKQFDTETLVVIGNARIDIGVFKLAKVRIATLQSEGIHTGILPHVDIIVPSITDALDLLLDNNTFAATMRL